MPKEEFKIIIEYNEPLTTRQRQWIASNIASMLIAERASQASPLLPMDNKNEIKYITVK